MEVRSFHTLVATEVADGWSITLVWANYPQWELRRSQNNLEERLIHLLQVVPDRIRIILPADRVFVRADLARTLARTTNVPFVVQVEPQVTVQRPRYTGQLSDYPVARGMHRV